MLETDVKEILYHKTVNEYCDKEYTDVALNFENDTAIMDFVELDFEDVKRMEPRFDVYEDLLEC